MNLDEKSLSLFVKFIMVCEDRVKGLEEELDNLCAEWSSELLDEDTENLSGSVNHYLYLYKEIKEHTGLTSKILEPKLKELLKSV